MSYKLKCMQGNYTESFSINESDDNTVTEGYISSEQLQKELENAGKVTTSYIERVRNQMSSEDYKAQQEQIESEEFKMQLRKASEDSKEKINQIFERSRLSKSLREQAVNMENMKAKFNKEMDEYMRKHNEETIMKLKKELEEAKKINNK